MGHLIDFQGIQISAELVDLHHGLLDCGDGLLHISELSTDLNALKINQMTRWINTKEEHAGKIIALMSEYCLCQRVKPVGDPKSPFKEEKDYIAALMSHHAVMLAAVKCKQTVDEANAVALENAAAEMSKMYLPA